MVYVYRLLRKPMYELTNIEVFCQRKSSIKKNTNSNYILKKLLKTSKFPLRLSLLFLSALLHSATQLDVTKLGPMDVRAIESTKTATDIVS